MKKLVLVLIMILSSFLVFLIWDIRQHAVSIDKKLDIVVDDTASIKEKTKGSLLLKM